MKHEENSATNTAAGSEFNSDNCTVVAKDSWASGRKAVKITAAVYLVAAIKHCLLSVYG
jgi:hypothetical protein